MQIHELGHLVLYVRNLERSRHLWPEPGTCLLGGLRSMDLGIGLSATIPGVPAPNSPRVDAARGRRTVLPSGHH